MYSRAHVRTGTNKLNKLGRGRYFGRVPHNECHDLNDAFYTRVLTHRFLVMEDSTWWMVMLGWMGGQSSVEQIGSSSTFMVRRWRRTTKHGGASYLMVDTLQSVLVNKVLASVPDTPEA